MDWYQERARRIEAAWGETVAELPIGTRVTGVVIETRPFGSFVELDGWPEALGLAKVSRMPHGMVLPAPGEREAGEVYWHTDHNHQVLLRLDAWT
ncbi:hypothetical protein [Streptomyces xiamenensis]|uniref:hypothetical protein n=1 Tax=Streptomyces xiamenensis TaxID=408015 RepID=UPI003D71DCB0